MPAGPILIRRITSKTARNQATVVGIAAVAVIAATVGLAIVEDATVAVATAEGIVYTS